MKITGIIVVVQSSEGCYRRATFASRDHAIVAAIGMHRTVQRFSVR